MPINPKTGRPGPGRPSNKEREERPDLFKPSPKSRPTCEMPPLAADPETGKRRRGRPTKVEQEERRRLAEQQAEARLAAEQGEREARLKAMEVLHRQEAGVLRDARKVLRRRRALGKVPELRRTKAVPRKHLDELLIEQSGGCAVCRVGIGWGIRQLQKQPLFVDYDVTGAVRGLLCRRCDGVINLADRDPSVLSQASDYVGRDV